MAHKDPERAKQYRKDWYQKNKVIIQAQHKQYYEDNKDQVNLRVKKYRKDLGDTYREYQNERTTAYRQKNPEKSMYILLKSRAKKNNIPFNLDLEDMKIPDECPVLKIPLYREAIKGGKRGPKQNSPSIDRIDNTKGYIKENIQVISHRANTMKGSATPEELLQFAFWVLLTYGHLINKEIS
jgi:hypothetical protein